MRSKSAAASAAAALDPRERILAAAFRVIARDTISGTRMPAIAREAGLSQGALHYYWESKDNLLVNLLDWLLDAFREGRGVMSGQAVPPSAPGDLAAGLERQIALIRLLVNKEPEMTRVYYDFWVQAASGAEPLDRSMAQQFNLYRAELKRGMLPAKTKSYDLNVLAGVVVGLLEGPVIQLALDKRAFELEEYLSLTQSMLTEMIERYSDD